MMEQFTFRYLFKEHKNTYLKRYMHTCVHCSAFYNDQDTHRGEKVNVVYKYI